MMRGDLDARAAAQKAMREAFHPEPKGDEVTIDWSTGDLTAEIITS